MILLIEPNAIAGNNGAVAPSIIAPLASSPFVPIKKSELGKFVQV